MLVGHPILQMKGRAYRSLQSPRPSSWMWNGKGQGLEAHPRPWVGLGATYATPRCKWPQARLVGNLPIFAIPHIPFAYAVCIVGWLAPWDDQRLSDRTPVCLGN